MMENHPSLTPEILARFEIRDLVSKNAWQILFQAWDRTLKREVVLQLPGDVYRKLLNRPKYRDRIVRQAQNLARIRHPCVMQIYELLDVPGGPVLVVEPTAGETLESRLARSGGRLPAGDVLDIAGSLGVALQAVHNAGLVHRNVAAENVILRNDGSTALVGFVFSKMLDPGASVSLDYRGEPGKPLEAALPMYPAPEVVRGQVADARSDIFSLGCVLHRCLTGESPSLDMTLDPGFDPEKLAKPPDPLDAAAAAVRRLTMKCLAPSPLARFQSAREFSVAVTAAGGKAPEGPPVSVSSGPSRPSEPIGGPTSFFRGRVGMALGFLVLLALAIFSPRLLRPGSGSGKIVPDLGRGTPLDPVLKPGAFLPTYEHSYALLIGIGAAYAQAGFRVLPNCERDVADLAAQLKSMTWENWNVSTLVGAEATEEGIRDALAELGSKADVNDRVLVYYAGHGERHPSATASGWIIPANARPAKQDMGHSTWLSFDDLDRFYDQCRAKHILIALDCCYSGIGVNASRGADHDSYSRTYLTHKARILLASSRDDQTALDGPSGGHSPFAEVLLDALKEKGDPLITSELMLRTQTWFVRHGLNQTPLMGHDKTSDQSEFVFFRRPDQP